MALVSKGALTVPPARSEGGLYGASTQRADGGRWLWLGGLSQSVSDPPDVTEWIEGQRSREGGGAALGSFKVDRHAGGAWVHFVSPVFAQLCLSGLNGRELPTGGNLRVRYAGFYEDTSRAPAVQYVKRAPAGAASSRGQVRPRAGAATDPPPGAAAKRKVEEGGGSSASARGAAGADGGDASGKRVKAEGSRTAVKSEDGKLPSMQNGGTSSASNGHAGSSSSGGPARTSASAGSPGRPAAKAGKPAGPQWEGGSWTDADVLRLALSKLDVDVALGEIVHFLTNDERLPGRTRKAVQFLHGLRNVMVQSETQKSNPELFDCPFTAAAVESYTFKEVRQRYGDSFRDKFWPVFQARRPPPRARLCPPPHAVRHSLMVVALACHPQAFNCVLPAHAPEETESTQTPAAALASFVPSAKEQFR